LGKRSKSREIALQVLYQIDVSNNDVEEAFNLFWNHFTPSEDLRDFSQIIVQGVYLHIEEIDAIIEHYSEHWRLKRMSIVDRNILRSAIFELLFCADVPPKVVLNEAVELGKKFGSSKSGSFVNGILDKVAHRIERIQTSETP
jgi:N utilization substance protein B